MHRTLTHLGLPSDRIHVHHLSKGTNVHSEAEASRIESYNTDKIIVLDQGSRPGEPIARRKDDSPRVLIIDHHQSAEVSASKHPTRRAEWISGQQNPWFLPLVILRPSQPLLCSLTPWSGISIRGSDQKKDGGPS